MNDKLTINTTLLRKEPCYEPKPCIVERVVEMSAGAFAKLISKPHDDHYLIKKNSDLMYKDNEFYYKEQHGEPVADETIFNTPIVLYSHKAVAQALSSDGTVYTTDGVYYADMVKLTDKLIHGVSWAGIGLPELYGNLCVDTTEPARSNSGNMFAALLANVLCGGRTADEEGVRAVLPQLKKIFSDLGYMETSSDLFNQFLRTGIGAKPIIAGYENQLLEYAAENPEQFAKIADDIVIIYPVPTIWSTHIYISLDEVGKQGAAALCDEKIQQLAWEKHGFRTSGCDISEQEGEMSVTGIPPELNSVINMPDYKVMKIIIEELED